MKIHSERIKTLRSGSFSGNGVLYWMQRDKRVEDNWALISSQYIALKHKVPLYVCFQYVGEYKESNIRHYEFLFKGLHQTASDLQSKNINFIVLKGLVGKVIPQLIESKRIDMAEIQLLYEIGRNSQSILTMMLCSESNTGSPGG